MITATRATFTGYKLDIPAQSLIDIMRKDMDAPTPLHTQLKDIDGVFDVDYSGHFGSHIFLSLMLENETEDTWKDIREIIENYL